MARAVVLVVVVVVLVAVLSAARARARHAPPTANGVEVPVECTPHGADAVLCHLHAPADRPAATSEAAKAPREGRRLFGFLAGLHLGGAISSTGSLSASHSINVFGKTMNTALSVSYGPNGYYQGPGGLGGGRPPLNPIGVPGFADDPSAAPPPSSTPSPDKGGEVSAVLAGSIGRDSTRRTPGLTKAEQEPAATPQNRLPVAEDIGGATPPGQPPHRIKVVVEAPASSVAIVEDGDDARLDAEPAPVAEEVNEDGTETVGEEPEPPPPQQGQPAVQLSSERRAQLEAVARVRTPYSADAQRRLFLQHHNRHVATFNAHHAKYNGDVSRVAVFSRS